MQIVIPVTGSRGDVQPYIALGKKLCAAGHDVRLVTHEDFEKPARENGLSFWALGGCSRAPIDFGCSTYQGRFRAASRLELPWPKFHRPAISDQPHGLEVRESWIILSGIPRER